MTEMEFTNGLEPTYEGTHLWMESSWTGGEGHNEENPGSLGIGVDEDSGDIFRWRLS